MRCLSRVETTRETSLENKVCLRSLKLRVRPAEQTISVGSREVRGQSTLDKRSIRLLDSNARNEDMIDTQF